jgi:hypothetical protein
MAAELAVVAYRARGEAQEDALAEALRGLFAQLVAEGMLTDRPPLLLRSGLDGTLLLLMQWRSPQEERRAQDAPAVNAAYARLEELAEAVTLGELEEAESLQPTFELL